MCVCFPLAAMRGFPIVEPTSPAVLRGSAVPCGGAVAEPAGTGCIRPRAAPLPPDRDPPPGHGHPLQPSGTWGFSVEQPRWQQAWTGSDFVKWYNIFLASKDEFIPANKRICGFSYAERTVWPAKPFRCLNQLGEFAAGLGSLLRFRFSDWLCFYLLTFYMQCVILLPNSSGYFTTA